MHLRQLALTTATLLFASVTPLTLLAAEPTTPLYQPNLHDRFDWWGDVDGFLDAQARRSLDLANQILTKYPPQFPEPKERRMALYLLDGVLHEEKAPSRKPVQAFLRHRITNTLAEIQTMHVTSGALIWKLYNETFVIRTPSTTFAFDLVRARLRGNEGFGLDDDLVSQIAAQCDALLISHRHRDHADETVARMFLDAGKPVVAPPEIWRDRPIHSEITHLPRIPHKLQSLPIQNGNRNLSVVVYPGHQGSSIENNVPIVITPEGLSFSHTGDQSNQEDFVWIDEIHQHYSVDVLLPNCWTTDPDRLIAGVRPKLIIPGHENEMGHTIDHREPFWLTYNRFAEHPAQLLVLGWGERFHYQP